MVSNISTERWLICGMSFSKLAGAVGMRQEIRLKGVHISITPVHYRVYNNMQDESICEFEQIDTYRTQKNRGRRRISARRYLKSALTKVVPDCVIIIMFLEPDPTALPAKSEHNDR